MDVMGLRRMTSIRHVGQRSDPRGHWPAPQGGRNSPRSDSIQIILYLRIPGHFNTGSYGPTVNSRVTDKAPPPTPRKRDKISLTHHKLPLFHLCDFIRHADSK